jgi:FemAB-related protein (PEP-CTERM system-associated)
MSTASVSSPVVIVHEGYGLKQHLPRLRDYVAARGFIPLSHDPAWLNVLEKGLGHIPFCLEATAEGQTLGLLPLCYIEGLLFGKFLVSLPYLNYGGVLSSDEPSSIALVDRAVALAERLKVRHLELRHVEPLDHPSLVRREGCKVHMRLDLPATPGSLWSALPSKVRNQVRKGQKGGLEVVWGGPELLGDFYAVFCENMRDLGTPVFGLALFRAILEEFSGKAELCVVRADGQAAAGALLLHGRGVAEVPSASSIRRLNNLCANMLMYWKILERATERGHGAFDFGRSTPGGNTYKFKEQWGAEPLDMDWQYYLRTGDATDMRPDNPRFRLMIRVWQNLPVPLTRWIGPSIVRGIP